MNRPVLLFFLFTMLLSATFNVRAQNHESETDVFVASDSQKGVAVSTDVVAVGLPLATLVGVLATHDWEGLKQGALTGVTAGAVTMLLKYTVKERRPDYSNYRSFPSGHSATTFATATFLQRRYGWKLGVPAYALATYTAWGRVFAKKHHWWDVVSGAAIGAGSALIYTRPVSDKVKLSMIPVGDAENIGFYAELEF